MEQYADHPGARRISRLAKRRQPEGWKSPRPPARAVLVSEVKSDPVPAVSWPRANGPAAGRARAGGASQGSPAGDAEDPATGPCGWCRRLREQGARVPGTTASRRSLDAAGFDENLAWVARGYFFWDRDRKALKVARRAIARSRGRVPLAYWWGGLAAWRLGEYRDAAMLFRVLAESKSVTPWMVSAGGYWASRAYRAAGESGHVVPMLRAAARHPRTFYGLLAITALGRRPTLDFGMRRLAQGTSTRCSPCNPSAGAGPEPGGRARAGREPSCADSPTGCRPGCRW